MTEKITEPQKWESVFHLGKDTKPVPAFKR